MIKIFILLTFLTFCGAHIPHNTISSHVLDIANGHPARGVNILAYFLEDDENWKLIENTTTDANGRVPHTHPNFDLKVGTYKFRFEVKKYFEALNQTTFYPYIEVHFYVHDVTQHYHVPITLSNWGYSTYRGS